MNQSRLGQLTLMACVALIFAGCGGKKDQWPSAKGDYARVAANRGLAKMWDVIIEIENPGGENTQLTESGSPGTGPEDANAQYDLQIGNAQLRLETTGKKKFKLIVDGKAFGTVGQGQRILVTDSRDVYVNNEQRK